MDATVRTTTLPAGESLPVLGLGTWRMGEDRRRRNDEIAALRLGLDLGMTLVVTAEMYADGAAEELAGEAIRGCRDEVARRQQLERASSSISSAAPPSTPQTSSSAGFTRSRVIRPSWSGQCPGWDSNPHAPKDNRV